MTVDLRHYMATREGGAGFLATNQGSFAQIEPLTPRASAWLRAHVSDESSWQADVLIVEHRYFPELADAIVAAGFTFERDAFPN